MEVTGLAVYVLVGKVNNDIIFTLLKVVSIFDRRNVCYSVTNSPPPPFRRVDRMVV
jgi:hypothetical protein